jgi:histidyl-tRNA synthetase
MNDLLPDEARDVGVASRRPSSTRAWRATATSNLRTPVVEPTALFVRGIGEVTDIVEKEMYSWVDAMNGERAHAAAREHRRRRARDRSSTTLLYNGAAARLWYMGPMFRHERPQKGRYRQFHQLGVEALGFAGAGCGRRDSS